MKKILTTLTVIAATALGAQAQTTVYFPNTGSTSLTNLTFPSVAVNLENGDQFDKAVLLLGVTGVPEDTVISFTTIRLSGEGITSTLNWTSLALSGADNLPTTTPLDVRNFTAAGTLRSLNTPTATWNSSGNTARFNISIDGPLPGGAAIYYAVQYSSPNQLNTSFGNVNLVAVPEPSTYAAAAGLLALFLWSSRRHLFKLAGARSAASGNGAA
jgi:hypothetical protein